MTDNELRAYLAGFFDGEGSIQAHRGPAYYRLVVTVGQIDPEPLRIFLRRYGGTMAYHKPSPARRGSWDWRISGRLAYGVLVDLRPYLTVKAGQCDLALAFQQIMAGYHHRPLHDVEHAERMSFYLALRDAKRAEDNPYIEVVP